MMVKQLVLSAAAVLIIWLAGCSKEEVRDADAQKPPLPATNRAPILPGSASTLASGSAGDLNPLFTLPPSKGPAPQQFKQISLYCSGPSGSLEMQLTGDGIYRIRDHAHGRSYAGDGKLTEDQIKLWAEGMKDWDTLKDRYVPDPAPKDGDQVTIFYGGKKVVANTAAQDLPRTFTDAYKRLLALNEQARKDAESAAPVDGADTEKKTTPRM